MQVISVPKHINPSQANINVIPSRQLMHRLERWGRKHNIPVHTQVRVANNTAEAILETIAQEHTNLLLMGWRGECSSSEKIFGNVIDTIITEATCELMLIKLGTLSHAFPHHLSGEGRWLIPSTDKKNLQRTLKFLSALANIYTLNDYPIVELSQVHNSIAENLSFQELENTAKAIADKLNRPVRIFPFRANSLPDAVSRLSDRRKYDLILFGASSKDLLHHGVLDSIPEAIAGKTETTVIIIRI